ncbi:MAG: winged helix-turn-helix domain-containing protein [Actinobacteria bacterium]|nr:winged helix-turn-helix domain-containing protein [Actinomycetota bacterium]
MSAVTRRPKYRQIADDLRAKISDGTYPVGAMLPSTSQLMASYDVSVTVARAAVKELQNEGIAEGQPGKAVYVQREPAPAEPSADYVEITQQIQALREALDQAVQELGDRLTRLEQAAAPPPQRSP